MLEIKFGGFMEKKIFRNDPCYCIKFRRTANIITKFYDQAFLSLDLTTTQFSLLNGIFFLKKCNKSQLALHAHLDRTTIIRSINLLLEKGLVQEISTETHRNKVILLTEKGENIRIKGMLVWEQLQKKIKSTIGKEKLTLLKEIFATIESFELQL